MKLKHFKFIVCSTCTTMLYFWDLIISSASKGGINIKSRTTDITILWNQMKYWPFVALESHWNTYCQPMCFINNSNAWACETYALEFTQKPIIMACVCVCTYTCCIYFDIRNCSNKVLFIWSANYLIICFYRCLNDTNV